MPLSGGAAAEASDADGSPPGLNVTSPTDGLLLGTFLPARDCPETYRRTDPALDPDQWSRRDRAACTAEDGRAIEARVQLVIDLFTCAANAYTAFKSSADVYRAFYLDAVNARPTVALHDDYRSLFDATSASRKEYIRAANDLANSLKDAWWAVRMVPAALATNIDGADIQLAEAARGGSWWLELTSSDSDDVPRAWFPSRDAFVPLSAPHPDGPARIGALEAIPGPVPVFYYGRFEMTEAGTFVARTGRELGREQGQALNGTMQALICEVATDYCGKAAAPEYAAPIEIVEGQSGDEHRGLVTSPPYYSICRAAIDWINKAITPENTLTAGILRTPTQDGLAYAATTPPSAGGKLHWIGADLLLTFVRDDLLATSDCWEAGATAWNCAGPFCNAIRSGARFLMPAEQRPPVPCSRDGEGRCILPP